MTDKNSEFLLGSAKAWLAGRGRSPSYSRKSKKILLSICSIALQVKIGNHSYPCSFRPESRRFSIRENTRESQLLLLHVITWSHCCLWEWLWIQVEQLWGSTCLRTQLTPWWPRGETEGMERLLLWLHRELWTRAHTHTITPHTVSQSHTGTHTNIGDTGAETGRILLQILFPLGLSTGENKPTRGTANGDLLINCLHTHTHAHARTPK